MHVQPTWRYLTSFDKIRPERNLDFLADSNCMTVAILCYIVD